MMGVDPAGPAAEPVIVLPRSISPSGKLPAATVHCSPPPPPVEVKLWLYGDPIEAAAGHCDVITSGGNLGGATVNVQATLEAC